MALIINSLEDLHAIRESEEVEAKLARGRNGEGEIPKDFWETYSAFANSRGGYIILGVKEVENGKLTLPDDVINVEKLKTDLFNQLNNKQKVSSNILKSEDVHVSNIDHRSILIIHIRPASRQHKPVYINGNPITGTYHRLHDGDRNCDPDTVKRLLGSGPIDLRRAI